MSSRRELGGSARAWASLAASGLALLAVVVVLPAMLIAYHVTPPVPRWPGFARVEALLRGRMSHADYLNVIVVAAWLGWARFTLGAVISGLAEFRKHQSKRVRYLGISQSLVKGLVRSRAVIGMGAAAALRYIRLRGGVESPPADIAERRAGWAGERNGVPVKRGVERSTGSLSPWVTYDPAALWWVDIAGRHLVATGEEGVGGKVRIMRAGGDGIDLFVDRGTKVGGLFDLVDDSYGPLDWWALDRNEKLARRVVESIGHPFPDGRIVPLGVDDAGGLVLANLGWTGPIGLDGSAAAERLATMLTGAGEVPWLDELAIVVVGGGVAGVHVDGMCANIDELRSLRECKTPWMLVGGCFRPDLLIRTLADVDGIADRSVVVGVGDGTSTLSDDGVLRVDGVGHQLGI